MGRRRVAEGLRPVHHHLPSLVAQAMKAGTWQQCRQILYHESLRYVDTAATHGRALPKESSARLLKQHPDD